MSVQGKWWMLTVPVEHYIPYLPPQCVYIKGQLECASTTGFLHWQIIVCFSKRVRVRGCRDVFGPFHCELTRSPAAREYVWKEETRVPGTQFELGTCPMRRGECTDWGVVWDSAVKGDLSSVPHDVRVRYYNTLVRIGGDYLKSVERVVSTKVFWGISGSGKSRLAFEQAGVSSYIKNSRTKWWCGYRSEESVVIDEFRGQISVEYLLRWLDRYPCYVEVKGGQRALCATKFWFTSNLHPRDWYPELDAESLNALLRRLDIVHFENPFNI